VTSACYSPTFGCGISARVESRYAIPGATFRVGSEEGSTGRGFRPARTTAPPAFDREVVRHRMP
jgi:glycine cleavage system aminomethyltransferase T